MLFTCQSPPVAIGQERRMMGFQDLVSACGRVMVPSLVCRMLDGYTLLRQGWNGLFEPEVALRGAGE